MVISPVGALLQSSLPGLSVRARAILEAQLLSRGSIGTAGEVAPHLGLRNRFELARLLKREGLPPLNDLAAWASVMAWVEGSERTGCSLCQLAFWARRDPAVCYRTVKRITGLTWHEVKRKGIDWVVKRFLTRLSSPSSAPTRRAAARWQPRTPAASS